MARYCVREEYTERTLCDGCGYILIKIWTFYYSDGDIETVTMRIGK